MAWYGWTQSARVKIIHMLPYSPPPIYLLIGVGAIVMLVLAAHTVPSGHPRHDHTASHFAPSPRVVGTVICALGAPWAALILLGWETGSLPSVPFGFVLAGGLAWAILTYFLVWRWTSSFNWGDAHCFALVFGGVLACMLGGFVVYKVGGALRIDWIGKCTLNAVAVTWLLSLLAHRRAARVN